MTNLLGLQGPLSSLVFNIPSNSIPCNQRLHFKIESSGYGIKVALLGGRSGDCCDHLVEFGGKLL